MIRIDLQVDLRYVVDGHGADFVFLVHAAHTACQSLAQESLWVSQAVDAHMSLDPATGNRSLRLRAQPGDLTLQYRATVDITHHIADPATIAEVPVQRLPPEVMGYIHPSRYCQSDRLGRFAMAEFGSLWQGYARVLAIQDWVRQQVAFKSNTSDGHTSAVDTLIERVGVCRDFAHLMIGAVRSMGLAARYVSGYLRSGGDLQGADASHAWVSVFCPESGWVDFDPTNNLLPDLEHITVAWGRDFSDVTPMRGVILGGGTQELDVSVTVTPLGKATPAPGPGS